MFKYTSKRVADLILNQNSIRIGTLEGFKTMEAKKGVSDPFEGSYIDHVQADSFTSETYYSNPTLRKNIESALKLGDGVSNCHFGGIETVKKITSKNYLIFCTAHKKSLDVMSQFEDAEVCLKITKPETLFTLITWALEKELSSSVLFHGVFKVNYDDYERVRDAFNSSQIHPAIVKTKEFEPQCELRAIWEVPDTSTITKPHYDLNILGVSKFCHLIEI